MMFSLPPWAQVRQHTATDGHQCSQCYKLYSRRDHLLRHMRSHQRDRPLRCHVCGRGFLRRDTLLRHSLLHNSSEHAQPADSPGEPVVARTISACHPCAVAKAKCGDRKPCTRCQERGIECVSNPRDQSVDDPDSFDPMISIASMTYHESMLLRTETPDNSTVRLSMEEPPSAQTTRKTVDEVDGDDSQNHHVHHSSSLHFNNSCTSIVPMRHGTLDSGADGSNIQSEALADQSSFLADIGSDHCFNDYGAFSSAGFAGHTEGGAEDLHGMTGTENPFRKSPMHYNGYKETPLASSCSADSTVSSESESIDLPERAWPTVPQIFDQGIRDTLLAMVARDQRLEKISPRGAEFPSAATMDILADQFLRKQNRKLDMWIHTATFDPLTAPPDLTFMILAAGALRTQVSYLHLWAYRVCRFMKRRLLIQLEDEDDSRKALPLLQALLVYLEVDSWNCDNSYLFYSGSLSDIMLNSLAKYSKSDQWSRESFAPQYDDQGAELQAKWNRWIVSEGFKRLAGRFCTFENQKAAALYTKPSRIISDLRISLPHPRSLWMARTASEWKERYLAARPTSSPTVKELLASLPTTPFPGGFFDREFAIKISAHLLEGLIVDHHLLSRVFNHKIDGSDQQTQTWKKDIRAAIENLRNTLRQECYRQPAANALAMLTTSYLSMVLNVFVHDLELLFGNDGIEESQKKYQNMQDWAKSQEAREAIWHAGQILRHLRYIERPLSGFIIVIAYQAGLVLLGYLRLRNQTDDTNEVNPAESEHGIILNGADISRSTSFVQHGLGKPALQYNLQGSRRTVSSMTPQVVVQVVMESMFDKASDFEQSPVLLTSGLVRLLRDITSGNIPGRADPRRIPNHRLE